MIHQILPFMAFAFFITLGACSSSGTTDSDGDDATPADTDTGLVFTSEADFATSAAASLSPLVKGVTTGQCEDLENTSQDDPFLEDGLDCDDDGGAVAHITPTAYSVAVKSAVLLGSDESTQDLELIADSGTLAAAEVVTFETDDVDETIVTIDPADLVAGTYSGVELQLYYLQMTFPVAGETRNVRIYMSDDDFASEGSLGHHQGDITFVGDDGTELGWVDDTWVEEALSETRTEGQNGAGGTDAETEHDRGFFGDATFWNAEDLDQGADQDIYVTEIDFDEFLEIPASVAELISVTLTFSVADTFFYEDFDPQNTADFPGFYPADGGEATSEGSAWAPLLPTMELTVE